MKNTYQIIEDNGGNLYLFVFDPADNVVGGIENLEYAQPGEYNEVKNGLASDPLQEIGGWDGHMDDPQATYDKLTSYQYGWQVVCDNGVISEHLGAAAETYLYGNE